MPAAPAGSIEFTPRCKEILADAFAGCFWSTLPQPEIMFHPNQPDPRVVRDPTSASIQVMTAETEASATLRGRLPRFRVAGRGRGEFMFLALIAHGDGVGANVLRDLGVDLERAAVALQHAAEADIDVHTITTCLPSPPASA